MTDPYAKLLVTCWAQYTLKTDEIIANFVPNILKI